MTMRESLDWIAGQYHDAGVHATADERSLGLPGVLTLIKTVSNLSLDHESADHEITVLLVASGAGPLADLDQLEQLVTTTTRLFGCTEFEAVSVRLDRSPTPLPGLRTTISIRSN